MPPKYKYRSIVYFEFNERDYTIFGSVGLGNWFDILEKKCQEAGLRMIGEGMADYMLVGRISPEGIFFCKAWYYFNSVELSADQKKYYPNDDWYEVVAK